jgi:hypothetical protein
VIQDGVHLSVALSRAGSSLEELCGILEHRAQKINRELRQHFLYAPVKKYLGEFNKLHLKHVEALRAGNVVFAHEVLGQIQELSRELSSQEFWDNPKAPHNALPHVSYSLGSFDGRPLIKMYVRSHLAESAIWGPRIEPATDSIIKEYVGFTSLSLIENDGR